MENPQKSTLDVVIAHDPEIAVGLTAAENLSLELIPASGRNSILEIGVGSGRMVSPLSAMFKQYIGIDISGAAIRKAQALYPAANLSVMDARNLEFSPAAFDCVMFSFNGIDCVGVSDREQILIEIRRVLRPGGIFIYSTHNLAYRRASIWRSKLLVKELIARNPIRLFHQLRNRLRLFWHQSHDAEHVISLINDPALSFSILLAYVDLPTELERLRRLGLPALASFGNITAAPGWNDSDCWVYVVARRESP